MRYAMPHLLLLLLLGCGEDRAIADPEPFRDLERVTLHFVGEVSAHGQPVEGAVVRYTVFPCYSYVLECDLRVTADTTDAQGHYSITAGRTCFLDEDLLTPADSVNGDALSARVTLGSNGWCGSGFSYGPARLQCTNAVQELDFDVSGCIPEPSGG